MNNDGKVVIRSYKDIDIANAVNKFIQDFTMVSRHGSKIIDDRNKYGHKYAIVMDSYVEQFSTTLNKIMLSCDDFKKGFIAGIAHSKK